MKSDPGTLRSCLYECTVLHRRFSPKPHEFLYRIFLFCIDLEELEKLANYSLLLGVNRSAVYSFQNKDHLGKTGPAPLRPRLIQWLRERGVPEPSRILFLTNLRIFGYVFNPIAIYYCFDAAGRPLAAVAQVGNTFGEQKQYLIPKSDENSWSARLAKNFYVSPFSELDLTFDFRFLVPGEKLHVAIDDYDGTERTLLSRLTGKRQALTTARLFWFLLKYPALTLRVIFLIHWQAFRLWLKKVPHRRKEANPGLQTEILNPQTPRKTSKDESSTNP